MQHEHDDADAVIAITTRWLHYAMEDLTEAEAMVRRPDYAPRHACFLAQQGAEKSLKAMLVFL